MYGSVARFAGRQPLFPDSQHVVLLHPAHDSHIPMLYPYMDQSLETHNSYRYEGRADGKDATEVQGESRQDAGSCRHTLCAVLVTSLRHIRTDQARRAYRSLGRRRPTGGDAYRTVARRVQFLHKSDSVCVLQQEVSQRFRRHFEEQALLRTSEVLRVCCHVLHYEHAQIVLLRQQQQLINTTPSWSRHIRVLHLQQYGSLGAIGNEILD